MQRQAESHPRLPRQPPYRLSRLIARRRLLGAAPLACGLLISLLSWPAAAAESPLYVRVEYGVDPAVRGCWDESEFRRSVVHRIGYDPFRAEAPLGVRIHVGGSANALDGHIEWRRANGSLMGDRRFVTKDGDCPNLLTEMSFAVGLQVELLRPRGPAPVAAAGSSSSGAATPGRTTDSGSSEGAAGEASPPPAPPPAPVRDPAEDAAPPGTEPTPAAPASSSRWTAWAGLGPSLAWRLSPGLTGDGRVFVGARRNDLSVEVAAEGTFPSTQRRWDGSGFRHYLAGGTLALCGHRQRFAGCALARASAARVKGVGVDSPRAPSGFVAQAGARVAASVPLSGAWLLSAHVDVLVLLNGSRVVLNEATVWDMPRLGTLTGIDLAVRFR